MTGATALHKNASVLDVLFREHSQWLTRWLNRQRWTVSASDDLTADVFMALLQLPDLERVRQPRAMMTTIARRLICDARRRSDLRLAYEAELAAMPEAVEISAEDRLILAQALQAIDTMLARLSQKARAAFLMSQIDGLPYAEIAAELKVSVSMVRKYVAQGLRAAYEAQMRQG
ncbi:RNA polymerase sigma-70 factor, ECF subfamily [Methylobacterium phyllostachyos]|uniref:RNA polymerase sigma-70 factor, ECF subfamily n=1 Tax=Methylobacterium phyllostachyos TaxID=582672 RepID=A0A1H0L3H2_9HYPH|nr:sigma-70 family RNA polymerase sigma factor [Methylobacterium phyllostachyos]SDO62635.1 RNA polymerase sigma-70 factor, ECF subfamily [Methylobacterium phyllostachyos]